MIRRLTRTAAAVAPLVLPAGALADDGDTRWRVFVAVRTEDGSLHRMTH